MLFTVGRLLDHGSSRKAEIIGGLWVRLVVGGTIFIVGFMPLFHLGAIMIMSKSVWHLFDLQS